MTNEVTRHEHNAEIFGVPAKFYNVVQDTTTGRIRSQQATILAPRPIAGWGKGASITVELRFDDACNNGHESFAITGEIRSSRGFEACGCLHSEIPKAFPELAPLIKWHLVGSDGPMHYVANTLYHAGDRDCYGLRKGERAPILGPDKVPTWVPKIKPAEYITGHEQPPAVLVEYEVWSRVGEGKERDLDAARTSAVWPDATDEELCQERPQLEAALKARLPALVAEFKQTMLDVGFIYPEHTTVAA